MICPYCNKEMTCSKCIKKLELEMKRLVMYRKDYREKNGASMFDHLYILYVVGNKI